jgi:hypothetical protein
MKLVILIRDYHSLDHLVVKGKNLWFVYVYSSSISLIFEIILS